MNKQKIVCGLLVFSLVFPMLFNASFAVSAPAEGEVVRFGYLSIAPTISFFVAVEKGFFKEQGLQIEPIKFETSNQILEAIVAGRLDASALIAFETALALEANTPGQFRITEMTAAQADTKVHRIMVKKDSPIKTLADLKGKKIGIFPGGQFAVYAKMIFGRYFDAERELEIIPLKLALQPQALETNQVDALYCLEPMGTMLDARGLARAISINPLYEYIQKPFPAAMGVVAASLEKEKPKTVAKIVAALTAAHTYMKEHPREAMLTIPKYVPIEAELATKIAFNQYWISDSIDRAAVQKLADFYADKGIIAKRIATSTLYLNARK